MTPRTDRSHAQDPPHRPERRLFHADGGAATIERAFGQQRRRVGKHRPLGVVRSLNLSDQRNRYGIQAQALAERHLLCGAAHVARLTAQSLTRMSLRLHAALDDGARADARMLKALAMAKLNYVASVFNVCSELGCRAFASIVETDARPTASGGLRKDYSYLFERFFYFLEDHTEGEQGIVVFDELDRSRSHLLIDQMRRYFADTMVGRRRSSHIIPEPFFVHSDLTTGVQIADIVAYVISWGFRTSRMIKPARSELSQFSAQVANLRYRATRSRMDNPEFGIWSFAHITDLRTQAERDGVP